MPCLFHVYDYRPFSGHMAHVAMGLVKHVRKLGAKIRFMLTFGDMPFWNVC
jgi:hypothetical protein